MSMIDIALPIVSLAAKKVPYPLMHTLIYYLKHKKLDLGYHFNMLFCPKEAMGDWLKDYEHDTIEYPHSVELSEDLANFVSADLLHAERGSAIMIVPGPTVTKNEKLYKDRFDAQSKIKFSKLQKMVGSALTDPKKLLAECRGWYINEI